MVSIKQKLKDGNIDEAIQELDVIIENNPSSDKAYYLRGDFQQALNNYLHAMEINPESPAKLAHDMLMDIMDFYYKEMYNQ